jgi:tetratricopeptide (TPR) repeat protein
MKKYYHLLIILGAVAMLSGCASGKKALQKGDYERAVSQAINRLRSNDDQKKARATLEKAYKYALESHLGNIKKAKTSGDIMKWESIARDYQYINFLADEIQRCPGCRVVVPNPARYDTQLAEAKRNAAEVHYNLGNEAMKHKQQRAKAIEAHQHFQSAQALAPRFKDVEEKLNEALYYATLRVVVEPIPSPSRMFNLKHEFFVNKINEYLHSNLINQYVRFYTQGEANAEKLDYVDHIIRMEFDRFNLGNVHSNKTTTDVSRDSVVIATKDNVKIYGTVKARLTTNEKAITGTGVLDFKVFDNGLNKVITQEKFPSEYTWAIRWASFNGDERALTEDQLKMVNTVEASAPSPQFMFEEFTAPLYNQVISKIRDYYRNY